MYLKNGLAYPLDTFYEQAGLALPPIQRIPGEAMPEPYRRLLVGNHDMTPTLEAFHGEPLELRVLERRVEGESLARLVALTLESNGRPVEFGAIIIHLSLVPPEVREAILEGHAPLGGLLIRRHVQHASCPQAFLQVEADARINEALEIAGASTLYGRRNVLLTEENEVLADILEILPPHET